MNKNLILLIKYLYSITKKDKKYSIYYIKDLVTTRLEQIQDSDLIDLKIFINSLKIKL